MQQMVFVDAGWTLAKKRKIGRCNREDNSQHFTGLSCMVRIKILYYADVYKI